MKPIAIIRHLSIALISFCFLLNLIGCGLFRQPPPEIEGPALVRIKPSIYPDFLDDLDYNSLENGILESMSYLNRISPSTEFRYGQDVFSAAHMLRSLEHFLRFIQTKPFKDQLVQFIQENYLIYSTVGSDSSGQVFFTGYYEPILEGSLIKDSQHPVPIYARPDDLTTIDLSLFSPQFEGETIVGRYINHRVVPYYDRKEIENEGLLEGRVQAIAWLKDRLDLFFLQIQGSGKIYLNNGEIINVHYHGANGHPYRSIGKLLIDEGKIPREEISMQKILDYLRCHPEEIENVLNYNPSYVFFKVEQDGPIGSIQVKLTPGRSIALDSRLFPRAGLAFIEARKPLINSDGTILEWMPFSRFVLNQDTGGAINGPARADLFWGNGSYAEIAAGHMQESGKLYFLILKPDIL